MKYVGFLKRFLAAMIDGLVMTPLIIIMYQFSTHSLLAFITIQLIIFIIGIIFSVCFLKYYGGSPGKLAVSIKVVKVNGEQIGWKEAILRCIVDYTFSITILSITFYELAIANIAWGSIKYNELLKHYGHSLLYNIISYTQTVWIWGELIVILTNRKKRSIHDFIAGTVVIYKNSVNVNNDEDKNLTTAST